MPADMGYLDYCQQRLALAEEASAQARELCDRYRERLQEAAAPVNERLQQLAASWQQALQQAGNGDDAQQRTQAAWLDHQRQYAQALGECRDACDAAGREYAQELVRQQRQAWDKALGLYIDFLQRTREALAQRAGESPEGSVGSEGTKVTKGSKGTKGSE